MRCAPQIVCCLRSLGYVPSYVSHTMYPAIESLTWIIVLIYLLVLTFLATSRCHGDREMWDSDVRNLRALTAKQTSAPPHTPTVVRTKQRTDTTRRPPRSRAQIAQHYGGLSSKYEVEPFHPVFTAPEQMDTCHSNIPEAIPLPKPKPVPSQDIGRTLSVSLGLYDMPPERERLPSSSYPGPSQTVYVPLKQSVSLPAPSPLGDWPRQDIMKQPVKSRKHKVLPNASEFPRSHVGGSDAPNAQPRPQRPSGPRLRMPSGENGRRPVALDLYPCMSASYIAGEVPR